MSCELNTSHLGSQFIELEHGASSVTFPLSIISSTSITFLPLLILISSFQLARLQTFKWLEMLSSHSPADLLCFHPQRLRELSSSFYNWRDKIPCTALIRTPPLIGASEGLGFLRRNWSTFADFLSYQDSAFTDCIIYMYIFHQYQQIMTKSGVNNVSKCTLLKHETV